MTRGTKKILVIKLSSLGDITHALPAVNFIKKCNPAHEIHWVVRDGDYTGLLRRTNFVSQIYALKKSWGKGPLFLEGPVQEMEYDYAFDFQGQNRSERLLHRAKAQNKYALARQIDLFRGKRGTPVKKPPLLHCAFTFRRRRRFNLVTYAPRKHIVERLVSFVEKVFDRRCKSYDFGLIPPLPKSLGTGTTAGDTPVCVGFHIGSAHRHKCWPAEYYVEVMNQLAKDQHIKPILFQGPFEVVTLEKVKNSLDPKVLVLDHEPDLRLVIANLAKLNLYVGNDSGITQIASALKVPTISIYGPTPVERNGPFLHLEHTLHHGRCPRKMKPCWHKFMKYGILPVECKRSECLRSISPDQVLSKIRNLLCTMTGQEQPSEV